MIKKEVKKFGKRSAHVTVPKDWIGKIAYLSTAPYVPPDQDKQASEKNSSAKPIVSASPVVLSTSNQSQREGEDSPSLTSPEPVHDQEPKPELELNELDEAESDFIETLKKSPSYNRHQLLIKGEKQFGKDRLALLVARSEERK